MTKVVLCALMLFIPLVGSCKKKHDLPIDPEIPFKRYQSDQMMKSTELNSYILYSVYLPEGYDKTKSASYPVVYLLHGLGNDHNSWNDSELNVTSVIDRLETGGNIEPMIYVMPQGFSSYYVNKHNGTYNYMDMFTKELVPFIDNTYRTISDREHRAVVGYSMGGFGAMILPTKNPDLFSISVPLSMSFRTDAQYTTESASAWNTQWGSIFGGEGQVGTARLTDYYKAHTPFHTFTAQSIPSLSKVKYFLDCGDDEEQLLVANDDLHVLMRDLGMVHEYRVRNGGHQSSYWRSAMDEVLPFINGAFNGAAYKSEETPKVIPAYSATLENKAIAAVPSEVYLPKDYATELTKKYPIVYFVHNGDSSLPAGEVMKHLDKKQLSTPFIMVACKASELEAVGYSAFNSAVEAEYRTLNGGDYRTGLGYGSGGRLLYEVTQGGASVIRSLFLVDAELDQSITAPVSGVFYYISISDMGAGYKSTNTLYKACHSGGVSYEYRTSNGTTSANTAIYGVQSLAEALGWEIKTN